MPAWKKAQKPLYSSIKFLKSMAKFKNSVVVIDTRPEKVVAAGHLEAAIAIAPEKLAAMQESFPAKKNAPVVIVAENSASALESFSTIRAWGYKSVSILKEGPKSWQKAELAIATGQTATKIAYVPKPIPGALKVNEFEKLVAEKVEDTVIIDVRTEDEVAVGTIPGALNIPTEEIAERLEEIPQGKKIVTYCSTGIRAEMAYISLKDNGYSATFLNGKMEVTEDGSYTISEKD